MLRFSLYQLIIVSVQLSPNFQTGLLSLLQLIFFGFYTKKCMNEGFFESKYTVFKFIVFEACVLFFLLLSFIFSFKNSKSWFGPSLLAWVQIIAALMIFLCLFVEFISLVSSGIINIGQIFRASSSKSGSSSQQSKKINSKQSRGLSEEAFNNQKITLKAKNASLANDLERLQGSPKKIENNKKSNKINRLERNLPGPKHYMNQPIPFKTNRKLKIHPKKMSFVKKRLNHSKEQKNQSWGVNSKDYEVNGFVKLTPQNKPNTTQGISSGVISYPTKRSENFLLSDRPFEIDKNPTKQIFHRNQEKQKNQKDKVSEPIDEDIFGVSNSLRFLHPESTMSANQKYLCPPNIK